MNGMKEKVKLMKLRSGFTMISLLTILSGAGIPAADAVTKTASAIPVLCYHRFGQYPAKDPFFVTLDEFRRQLTIIKEEGFTPIRVSELDEGLNGGKPLPAKPILITMDDGYNDVVKNALPILKEFGYRATLFAYPVFVNSKNGLTPAQLRQLRAEGWDVGSHSYSHPKLTKTEPGETPEKYAKRLNWELAGSRRKLQEWLGAPVEYLAYPYGLWNQAVADAARAAGYKIMFTVNQGTNAPDTPRDQWKRIMVVHGTSDKTFRFILHDQPLPLEARTPRPGQVLTAPLMQAGATLTAGFREQIDPKTITALLGSRRLRAAYQPESGRITLDFSEPWTCGTNALVLTARDIGNQRHFKECWLVNVAPAEGSSVRAESQK